KGAQSISPAAGMIERVDRTSAGVNLTLETGDHLIATAGVTGVRQATATFSDTSVAQLIALRPASGPPVNNPPTMSIRNPASGASFIAPANIGINVSASDVDGTISKIECFQGSTLLGSSTSSSLDFVWSNVPVGNHILTMKATDNAGAVTTSDPRFYITVIRNPEQWMSNVDNIHNTNSANVGIGTTTPIQKLDVRGNLLLEANANPILYTGTGVAELNRYLHLLNSPGAQSASGLKVGGMLVSDAYSFANPGKNDLIVKGNVGIGTASPTNRLHVFGGNIFHQNSATAGQEYGFFTSINNSLHLECSV
ncbi:MAG: Ig-like domain-containing protein, partial [Chloroflexia bacterium]